MKLPLDTLQPATVEQKKGWINLTVMSLILVMGFFYYSCSSEEPQLKLTSAQRDLVDTMFYHKVDSLGPILNAECAENREKRLQVLIDSMIGVRQSEEAYLRQKYIPAFHQN